MWPWPNAGFAPIRLNTPRCSTSGTANIWARSAFQSETVANHAAAYARTADKVTIHFKDGRLVTGALIFNPFKGTGRIINIDQEVSLDFAIDEIRDLKM
jgi:hypothetical protein